MYATITVHHLCLTYDDVGGDRLCPANYCKPVAKRAHDRLALIEAATWGHHKFFFGSDSAPHPREGKERMHDCCAGIFTAPVALPLLTEIFERHGALDRLETFVCQAASCFYELAWPFPEDRTKLTLVKEPMMVPKEINGVVPFMAGQQISWSIKP